MSKNTRYVGERSCSNLQIDSEVITLIHTHQESQEIISQLSVKLTKMFQCDGCLIISGINNIEAIELGFWHQHDTSYVSYQTNKDFFAQCLKEFLIEEAPSSITTYIQKIAATTAFSFLPNLDSLLLNVIQFAQKDNGLILLWKSQSYLWQTSEKNLLSNISQILSLSLANIQLQKQATIRYQYHLFLQEITRQIHQLPDLESIYNLVLTKTSQLLQSSIGVILLLKYSEPISKNRPCDQIPQGKVELVSQFLGTNDTATSVYACSFQLSDSPICQQAWQSAPRHLTIKDTSTLPLSPLEKTLLQLKKYKSLLMFPLMGHDLNKPVVLGFIFLQNIQPHIWNHDQIDLVKCISAKLSDAIIYQQTLRQVQSLVDERTAQLKLSLDVQAKLSSKMRQHIQELKKLNEVKDKFISSLSDALKHPLTKIKMSIEMLKLTIDTPQRDRYLDILKKECDQEINLVNDLLTLEQLQSHNFPSNPREINLPIIIRDLAVTFEQQWATKGLSLKVNYLPNKKASFNLYTDGDSLNRILQELLNNAGKFSHPQTMIEINIAEKINPPENQVIFSIINQGMGISQEEQALIFTPFHQGDSVPHATNQGTGLGLALVQSLVEHLNGTIEVSSQAIDQVPNNYLTCFTITLPQTLTE